VANPVTHFEIMGKDSARLQRFYRDLFDWALTPPVADMGNYSLLQSFEPGIGGGIGEARRARGCDRAHAGDGHHADDDDRDAHGSRG
jgi:predicted enzyme related to lactoylglutathione lyase